jgi:repressor LexA
MRDITERQKWALYWINDYMCVTGFPPTVREIARALGGVSSNAGKDVLAVLARKGYVRVTPKVARGIRILRMP